MGGTYLGMVTASSGAEAVFSGGAYQYLKVEDGGTAVVKDSAAFGEDVTVTKGTLTVEGGSFSAAVVVEGNGTMNVNGGSFTGTGYNRVKYSGGAKGTVSGGSFAARTSSTQSHTLTITADADEVTGSSPYQLELTISVLAEQVD